MPGCAHGAKTHTRFAGLRASCPSGHIWTLSGCVDADGSDANLPKDPHGFPVVSLPCVCGRQASGVVPRGVLTGTVRALRIQ